MIENFEVFYKAFLQFSVNTARRIVKDEHIANDIAHNVFPISLNIRTCLIFRMKKC